MATELLIRPSTNDHRVVADLLAPGGASILLPPGRPLISRLVVDGHIAVQRPQFAEAAATSGTPLLIDPLTPLWQGELRRDDKWALLPFGTAAKVDATEFQSEYERERRTQEVVDFQLEQGASAVIPPYAYAAGPDDLWFEHSLRFIRATARYMARNGISVPLVPILCGRLQRFSDSRRWRAGVDRFAQTALDVGPQAIAFCLSPTGAPTDSYSKILRLFLVADRLCQTGVTIFGWRQGIFGPALAADGIGGYETGIATRELCDIAASIARRRPPRTGQSPARGAIPGIYIEPLRRTVSARAGLALLGDLGMRPKVMCDDERCCPNGIADTIDRRREHAIRCRAKELADLDGQPHRRWRLHHVAKNAKAAADLAVQATAVLKRVRIPETVNPCAMEALARVSEFVRDQHERKQAA